MPISSLNVNLKKQFKNTFKFSNNDINRFILLFKKSVYPYKYIDKWEKFSETILPEKDDFYSNLNIQDGKDSDYNHSKKGCKDFEIKHLGEYQDLYFKSNRLRLPDVFENIRKFCLEIY